jgi:uncharacterized protein (TIGR02266 family)
LHVLPTVTLKLRDPSHLLESFFHYGNTSGVFLLGEVGLEVGAEVQVTVTMGAHAEAIHFRGRVSWKRLTSAGGLPPGAGVDFLAGDARTRDVLLALAEGREVHLVRRKSPRHPIAIAIEYRSDASFLSDVTDDLSADGAFIATTQDLSVGTELALRIRIPGRFFALKLRGRVRWVQKDGRPGLGVQFLFESAAQREKLLRLIAEAEARVAKGLGRA